MLVKALPTLYKKSASGKIQQWDIGVHSNEAGDAFTQVQHGQVGGKMQTTAVKYNKGKNLGRANSTNALSQAQAEAESKWRKQQDSGYTVDPSGVGKRGAPLPMLAHTFQDYGHKVTYPCWVQPKLDGMRCLAVYNEGGDIGLWSRKGKTITTMPHIQEALRAFLREGEVFDGELYAHGIPFQQQISWFKKFSKQNYQQVSYHIYDLVGPGRFTERYLTLTSRIVSAKPVLLVPTRLVHHKDQVVEAHDKFVKSGYEGAMIRHGDCKYVQNKRSQDLLKVKKFQTEEFKIVGAYENIGKLEGTCTFVLETADGTTFDCMPAGSDMERQQLWRDYRAGLLTGQEMTVKFFEWTSSEHPVPRFPTGVGVRSYE
jgi:DNA ligase-1